MIRYRLHFCLISGFALALSACGSDSTKTSVPTQGVSQFPDSTQVTNTPDTTLQENELDANEVKVLAQRFRAPRDPFEGVINVSQERRRFETEITHPLQKYTIQQIKLQGIIWGIAAPTALVSSPDSQEFIVKVGTPMGTSGGKVAAILADRVIVIERYYDYRGQLQTERYELLLPKDGE